MKTKKFMPIFIFATAALMPTALFGLGLAFGGLWAWAGFIYIAGFAALMDRFGVDFAGAADDTLNGDWLLVVLAGAHLLLLPLLIAAIVIEGPMLPRLGLFLGAALWLGQISNPMAHELIHRGSRALFWLGAVVFSTLGFGHHTSAHRLVHHRFAASPHDPNTARSGEGFYAFFSACLGGQLLPWPAGRKQTACADTSLCSLSGDIHPQPMQRSNDRWGRGGIGLVDVMPLRPSAIAAVGLCATLWSVAPNGCRRAAGTRQRSPQLERALLVFFGDDVECTAPFRSSRPPSAPLRRASFARGRTALALALALGLHHRPVSPDLEAPHPTTSKAVAAIARSHPNGRCDFN